MNRKIFFVGILFISLIIFIMYIINEKDHQKELDKIRIYEEKNNKRQQELEIVRARTTPCHIQNLNDPRSCYFNSDFQCSWNSETERCDKK